MRGGEWHPAFVVSGPHVSGLIVSGLIVSGLIVSDFVAPNSCVVSDPRTWNAPPDDLLDPVPPDPAPPDPKWPRARVAPIPSEDDVTLAAEKKALRLGARAARARAHALGGSTAQDAAGRALEILPFRAGQIISAYWPVGDELDTRPLMAALAARGCILALPKVVGRHQPLLFQRWRPGDPLVPGILGIPAPLGEGEAAAIVQPEILVVPLLAFDRKGFRLGQGGGYYDLTLQVLRAGALRAGRAVLAAGFAYGAQEIASVPRDAHDQRLDWIITEREAIEVPR